MADVIAINEPQSFYFQMKEQLQIKNSELEEAHKIITKMNNHVEEFSRFYKEGYITEIKYADLKRDLKSIFNYYEGRVNKLNTLIPDIDDYINEYEEEYGVCNK